MTTTIYTPYTYLIGWTNLNKFYYGVRFARNCHPSDLWVTYFTSSKHVLEFRKQHGEPDIIQIRETFPTDTLAREWEHKVLRRLQVRKSEKWLNKTCGDGKFYCTGHSEETKQKLREANIGKSHSEEARQKISAANKLRDPISEEARQKISAANKGKSKPPLSDEHKRKLSEARIGISLSEETRCRMSKPKSEEHRRKLREAWKIRKNKLK